MTGNDIFDTNQNNASMDNVADIVYLVNPDDICLEVTKELSNYEFPENSRLGQSENSTENANIERTSSSKTNCFH